jgi:hypothetical protein
MEAISPQEALAASAKRRLERSEWEDKWLDKQIVSTNNCLSSIQAGETMSILFSCCGKLAEKLIEAYTQKGWKVGKRDLKPYCVLYFSLP